MELKPCPFCGAQLERRESNKRFGWKGTAYIHPTNGCIILQWKIVTETDAEKWNRRADNV